MTGIQVDVDTLVWTREGFHRRALQAPPSQPARLTLEEYRSLTASKRKTYNAARFLWHEKLEFIPLTTTAGKVVKVISDLVASQPNPESTPKRGIWIDGESNSGKTTATQEACYRLIREELATGELAPSGSYKTPVVWIDLSERPTFRAINRDGCTFLNARDLVSSARVSPAHRDQTAHALASTFASWAIACGVRIVVLDDTHNLKNRFADADMTGNYLKHLMTLVPAVFVLVGTDIEKNTQLLNEGSPLGRLRTQTAHRFKHHKVPAFANRTDGQREAWLGALKSVEKRLVLCSSTRGMLTSRPDYIFERTNGFIGSLVAFARDATFAAITQTTDERVDDGLLDGITADYAAESGAW